jgi:hypothetical protein
MILQPVSFDFSKSLSCRIVPTNSELLTDELRIVQLYSLELMIVDEWIST